MGLKGPTVYCVNYAIGGSASWARAFSLHDALKLRSLVNVAYSLMHHNPYNPNPTVIHNPTNPNNPTNPTNPNNPNHSMGLQKMLPSYGRVASDA